MGNAVFADLLATHGVGLGVSTRFDLGPFGLAEEMAFAQEFGASLIVTGSEGPKDLTGEELRAAVADFAEALKPHITAAEKHGIIISIEKPQQCVNRIARLNEVADRVHQFSAPRHRFGTLPPSRRCGIGSAAD